METAETELMEYLIDESHPLHTNFVLPNQGQALRYTCPVYIGSLENKQKVSYQSPESVGNLCLSLWISSCPET